mgnify:CR=1 FL=1
MDTTKGYVDIKPDEKLDLVVEINQLRKEKNAVILAHYYQYPEIQDIADYVGDSLGLSQQAAETDADIIVFAGVHFMAETAKIINPTKKVVLPDLNAGCSLADSCPERAFEVFTNKNPNHVVVSYINCSAEIKALTDIVCTSSNAVRVIESIPKDRPIIFAPDKNLGRYVSKKTGREMLLWDGACEVHIEFSNEKIEKLKKAHPNAQLIAHPESQQQILDQAQFIGSTSALLHYVEKDECQEFIVATEVGILHKMKQIAPHKKLIPAPIHQNNTCACSECPYMKLNTLEKIYNCLKYELPEVQVAVDIQEKAIKSIDRMLSLS